MITRILEGDLYCKIYKKLDELVFKEFSFNILGPSEKS